VGLEPEERPFRPHVTLARVRPQQDVAYLLDHQVDLAWKTKEIVLFKTKLIAGRSTYERLESFAL
jgi:2'-5' RNA ligase